MLLPRNRQGKKLRRSSRQPLTLEVLEDRTLLSSSPTTILDLNGLTVNPNQYSSTDILVQFQKTPGAPGGSAIVSGTTLGSPLPLETNFYQVNLTPGMTVDQALAAYKAEQGVLDAEPDYELSVSSVPNDPQFNQQWALHNSGQSGGTAGDDIHAEQAWGVTTGNRNIVVAVLDTGIDYDDTDLAQNIWINQAAIPSYWYTKTSATSGYNKVVYKSAIKTATPGVITMADLNNPANAGLVWKSDGHSLVDAGDLLRPLSQGGWEQSGKTNALIGWNFVNGNNNPLDGNGHGTNVAGILGATGNNGTGVAGVDWNVQIMPVQFMGSNGEGSVSNFIQALNFAVQNGAKITNNSWEGAPYSSALYDAFLNAQQHGVISVTAAGNEDTNNDSSPDYPANLSTSLNSVVAVAATTNTNQLASFSNYGAQSVALAAPGVNILSTLPNNQYGAMSGTSMAAPEVTGAMALVWGLHPTWSYTQVINQVLGTTQKVSSLQGKVKTGGVLDLAAAVGYSPSISSVPAVTGVSYTGLTSTSMNCITVKFNEPINISSLSSSTVTLRAPNGSTIPVVIRSVAGSNDEEVQVWCSNQSTPGDYQLSLSSGVRSMQGVALTPYKTTLVLSGAKTYTNSTSTVIAAKGLTMSSITVPAGTNIGNIQVTVNATFPDDSDLYLYLISPTGKAIALDYNRGGTGANLTNTVFSESASKTIASGTAPFTGSFLPEVSLNQLNGSSAGGTWRLGISNSGSVTGKLLNWSLTITPAASASSTNSTTPPSTPTPAAKTYTNSTAESIKANSLTVSSLTLPASTIGNLTVKLNVNYPVDKDLYVYLISPTGKTIALDYNRGGTGVNFTNTVFSQQASTPIADGKAPFSGSYRPEASLSQLNGTNSNGTWRLAIRNYGSHSGTLLNWSLSVTPASSSTTTTTAPTTSTTKTYTDSTLESIKPNSLTVSSVTVPAGTVRNVEVRLNVSYADDRDLYVYLISPTGKTIALDYNRGGWSANLSNTVFSDQASTPIANGKAPFSGNYRPEASLSQLNGSKAGGAWRLAIRNYGSHYGTLQNWSLILTSAS